MTVFLSGLDAEVGYNAPSKALLSGHWTEVAQVQQKAMQLSGQWAEVAQVQQKPMILSSHWVEVVYLVGVDAPPPEPPPPPPPLARRRELVLGLSRKPTLVPDPVPLPPAPDALVLTAEGVSVSQILLGFEEFSEPTITYVYRLNGGDAHPVPEDHIVAGLTANTPYDVEVQANRGGSPGPWSNLVSVRTFENL